VFRRLSLALGSAVVLASGVAAGPASAAGDGLTPNDVQVLLAQAVGRAQQLGVAATIAVVDQEGNPLVVFGMNGARASTTISAGKPLDQGLEGVAVPSTSAAVSKAGTAAFLSSDGSAISTRTAGFMIQEHFPPGVPNHEAGPLFGVQFSQLPCSDVVANPLPLGLSGDPGGMPIYKNGLVAGGLGVEVDGHYGVDQARSVEESIAVAATQGFAAPTEIRADQVTKDDPVRLPYATEAAVGVPAADLSGMMLSPVRAAPPSRYQQVTLGGIPAKVDPRFFPPLASAGLSADDVTRILTQAVRQAAATPSAIRDRGSAGSTIAVVGADGAVLGMASTRDAPEFGFDVSAQKARTAAFASSDTADGALRAVAPGYADAFAADDVPLDGSIAFSSHAIGALSRPFFPDGQDGTVNGPASRPIAVFSPFNTGLQLELIRSAMFSPGPSCTPIPALRNGIQPHAGAVPLYKGGTLVGAIGISGDGIDQDDLVSASGSRGFEAPAAMTADRLTVRGHRLPYLRFPPLQL
jgi:uncharacterized protein GlcG (DUF336 family)